MERTPGCALVDHAPRTEQDACLRKGGRESLVGVTRLLELLDDGLRQHQSQDLVGVLLLIVGPQDGRQPVEVRDFLGGEEWERSLIVRSAHENPGSCHI